MKVEIWSDFVCPFCYIGKRHFEQALSQLPYREEVDVVYRSFELDPNAPCNTGQDIHSVLAQKFGMSVERAREMHVQMADRAKEVGLTYHFDTMIPTNSFDAHRLMHFAAQHGKTKEMVESLFRAYFTDSKDISDHATLARLVEEVGLPMEQALSLFDGDAFTQNVRADEQEGQRLGIRGVPFFVMNRKYAVSGAQPIEVFLDAFAKAKREE